MVQNIGTEGTEVRARFYNKDGTLEKTVSQRVEADQGWVLYNEIPRDFDGSAEVSAAQPTQPIVSMINVINVSQNVDLSMAYNASNR